MRGWRSLTPRSRGQMSELAQQTQGDALAAEKQRPLPQLRHSDGKGLDWPITVMHDKLQEGGMDV